MMKHTLRITFTGDIMCGEKQDLVARNNEDNYLGMFSLVKDSLKKSDYVVGNLETTLAGKKLCYTNQPASFNTPEPFAYALKDAGFSLLSNANNHIMDRGIEGLVNTLDTLDLVGLDHIGAYRSEIESEKIFVKQFGNFKIAFIALTYGINQEIHHNRFPKESSFYVDLLKSSSDLQNWQFLPSNFIYRRLTCIRRRIKNLLGIDCSERNIIIDCVSPAEIDNPQNKFYLDRALKKISKAKNISDFVVVSLHIGGQSNNFLGDYTKYILEILKNSGADLIVGNHPHCVLGHCENLNCFTTFSLGNFTSIPNNVYSVKKSFSEYSILLHCDIDTSFPNIRKYSFSYLKNIMDIDGYFKPCPVYKLYVQSEEADRKKLLYDIRKVAKRFGVIPPKTIKSEYSF